MKKTWTSEESMECNMLHVSTYAGSCFNFFKCFWNFLFLKKKTSKQKTTSLVMGSWINVTNLHLLLQRMNSPEELFCGGSVYSSKPLFMDSNPSSANNSTAWLEWNYFYQLGVQFLEEMFWRIFLNIKWSNGHFIKEHLFSPITRYLTNGRHCYCFSSLIVY